MYGEYVNHVKKILKEQEEKDFEELDMEEEDLIPDDVDTEVTDENVGPEDAIVDSEEDVLDEETTYQKNALTEFIEKDYREFTSVLVRLLDALMSEHSEERREYKQLYNEKNQTKREKYIIDYLLPKEKDEDEEISPDQEVPIEEPVDEPVTPTKEK